MKKRKSGITLDVGKPVLYYPGLRKYFEANGAKNGIARDAAIFYGNLNFWQDRGSREDGFVYKYIAQLEKETGLSKYQQFQCRSFLKELGWIEEKKVIDNNNQEIVAFMTKYSLTTKAEAEMTIPSNMR